MDAWCIFALLLGLVGISLSPLTFTHDHARIITVEQLYRVQMVMQNHPYHHR